jgi:hypothetical protein
VTKWSFLGWALLVGAGSAVACSSGGDDSASSAGSGGSAGSTSAAGAGGTSSTGSLYNRLGGNSGIRTAVEAIITAETMDPMIASYFSQQANPAHQPTAKDIEDCLVLLLGSLTGGTEVYPGKATSGFMCRSMVEAHADLDINSGTFDQFVTIAAGVLKDAGVADADITVIGNALNATKTSVVSASPDSDTERACTAPAACAAEAGASGAN